MAEPAEANIGNDFRFQVEAGSPAEFEDMCAVIDVEIGEEKALLDITTLCSEGREYRNGLADGIEIPLKVNFKAGDTQTRALYADFKNDQLRRFRLVVANSGSPHESFDFSAVVRGWNLSGVSPGGVVNINFKLKISGDVDWNQP